MQQRYLWGRFGCRDSAPVLPLNALSTGSGDIEVPNTDLTVRGLRSSTKGWLR